MTARSSTEDHEVPLGYHPRVCVSSTWVGKILLSAGKPCSIRGVLKRKFTTYVEEVKPIADRIVDILEQKPSAEP